MSRKKEHKKGGKQYWQERKRKMSEEDSVGSQKFTIEVNHHIAQLILEKIAHTILCEVPQIPPTEHGTHRFGSTGQ